MNKLIKGGGALALYCTFLSPASAAVSLGSGGSGLFAKFTAFLQSIVNFLGGTGTLFVVFAAASAAIMMWIFMPKNAGPAIAWLFRICIGAIMLFGVGLLITMLQGF
ncbi:hypothetical protein [Vibrio tapetis]|uniref:Conjugal transfer protein TrbC n=1 Tax=Vibrio tapetis subsp. tapetis TaxID=1671868 RepID=A0A2N8ZHW2_9VIBR|nr:hypothetical protein [Vibrio tapetis]SON51500.1 conserved membrane protein of unknown function [Vibrio tapetis subsp. tapetis]